MQLFSFFLIGKINLKNSLYEQGAILICSFNACYLDRSDSDLLCLQSWIYFIWQWWVTRAMLIHIYTAFSTFSSVYISTADAVAIKLFKMNNMHLFFEFEATRRNMKFFSRPGLREPKQFN